MTEEFVKKSDCDSTRKELLAGLKELKDWLIKDNGTKSVQTRLNDLTTAVTNLTNVLAEHIKSDKTALSRNLTIVMKSMIIISLLYGIILFIVRTAPLATG